MISPCWSIHSALIRRDQKLNSACIVYFNSCFTSWNIGKLIVHYQICCICILLYLNSYASYCRTTYKQTKPQFKMVYLIMSFLTMMQSLRCEWVFMAIRGETKTTSMWFGMLPWKAWSETSTRHAESLTLLSTSTFWFERSQIVSLAAVSLPLFPRDLGNNHTTLSTCSFIHQHRSPSVKHFQRWTNFPWSLPCGARSFKKCIDWLPFQYGSNIFPWHFYDPVFLHLLRIRDGKRTNHRTNTAGLEPTQWVTHSSSTTRPAAE